MKLFTFAPEVREDITAQVQALIMTSRIIRTLMLDSVPDSDILPFVNVMVDQLNDPKNEYGIWAVIEICARADTEWSPSPPTKVKEIES
jgi:hypothetical protein